ncbi:hypothetical protein Sjap_002785 [Stephania japonica]|uniref:Putative plant transposon protein domain-containing protein n=1 Tax=Stephania japonica TaxID=461633 RepID=A0AAP0PUG1_9MAGN
MSHPKRLTPKADPKRPGTSSSATVSIAPKAPKRHRTSSSATVSIAPKADPFGSNNDAADRYSFRFCHRPVIVEREFNLSDFDDLGVPQLFKSRQWLGLFNPEPALLGLVKEFYSLIPSSPATPAQQHLSIVLRGTRCEFSPDVISQLLMIPRIENPQYDPSRTNCVDLDAVASTLVGVKTTQWTGPLPELLVSPLYRVLSFIANSNIYPRTPSTVIDSKHAVLLYCIGTGVSIDLGSIIFGVICRAAESTSSFDCLPFGSLITRFARHCGVRMYDSEERRAPVTAAANAVRYRRLVGAMTCKGKLEPQTPLPSYPLALSDDCLSSRTVCPRVLANQFSSSAPPSVASDDTPYWAVPATCIAPKVDIPSSPPPSAGTVPIVDIPSSPPPSAGTVPIDDIPSSPPPAAPNEGGTSTSADPKNDVPSSPPLSADTSTCAAPPNDDFPSSPPPSVGTSTCAAPNNDVPSSAPPCLSEHVPPTVREAEHLPLNENWSLSTAVRQADYYSFEYFLCGFR